jgi:serine/threonine-protein kinase
VVHKPAELKELSEVRLAGGAAHDYDPEGDNDESPEAADNVLDGIPASNWNTETYQGGFAGNGKTGVGLYVDAGRRIRGRGLTLVTGTPGFKAAVYGSETVPAKLGGWSRLSDVASVNEDHTFRLRPRGKLYRYYLLWISELPEGEGRAVVQELSLLR